MLMYDICGNQVNIDVRQSKRPLKYVSKSKIQKSVGEILRDEYPYDVILEEFNIPGSKMSIDFFLPSRKLAIEVSPAATHQEYTPFFHGKFEDCKLGKQKQRDASKAQWCEMNEFTLVVVEDEKDFNKLTKAE